MFIETFLNRLTGRIYGGVKGGKVFLDGEEYTDIGHLGKQMMEVFLKKKITLSLKND